jgi:hypothetical protein
VDPVIARYVLHVELHRGYRPRISFRRAPRPGDRVIDGGVPGTLEGCSACSCTGLLHRADIRTTRDDIPLPSDPS